MAKGRFPIPGKFLQYKKKEKETETELQPLDPSSNPNPNPNPSSSTSTANAKSKKKTGSRLWMRFDRTGHSELLECDKSAILKRVSIPARDLRILGPVFSHSSNILGMNPFLFIWLRIMRLVG